MIWHILWALAMGSWAVSMYKGRYDMAIFFSFLGLLFAFGSHSK